MPRIVRDWIKMIVPRKNHNTHLTDEDRWESTQTTDMISLRPFDEIIHLSQTEMRRSLTDFALICNSRQSSFVTTNEKYAGKYWLPLASTRLSVRTVDFFGRAVSDPVDSRDFGTCPSLLLQLPPKFFIRNALREIGEVKKVQSNDGLLYYTIELGEYPKTKVPDDMQKKLESMYNDGHLQSGFECTGRLYTTIRNSSAGYPYCSAQSPEFEFAGERYVRATIENRSKYDRIGYECKFADGSEVGKTGDVLWFKVEPITFRISNYSDVASGRTKVLVLDSDEIILSGIPFYTNRGDENCNLWQNSMIRAFLNSTKTSEMDGNPDYKAPIDYDFRNSGFLHQAFNTTREPTREYIIPENEKEICNYAFRGCVGIEKIIIPPHVTCIGESAFSGCVNAQIFIQSSKNFIFLDSGAFEGTDYKFIYLSKDGENLILSPREDKSFDKDYFKFKFKSAESSKLLSNSNYRENFIQISNWKEAGAVRFIPPDYVLSLFPSTEMKNFFVNNNNQRWANLIKTAGFDKLNDVEKENTLTDLMKICYAIGGFSENQGESEVAFDYITKYVANGENLNNSSLKKQIHLITESFSKEKSELDSIREIGEEIHRRFSKIKLDGPFSPKFAKFFMKYYHENPDFMKFRFRDRDGLWMDRQDYLCAAHNEFKRILKTYPYRDVNGNEERSLLTPKFVAEHSMIVSYCNVEEGNEKLAEIVGRYGYSQEQFEKIQEIYNKAKEIKDDAILCAEKPKNEDGITFRFLEKDDPLGFVIGDITNCCQHIGREAESCVIDGYLNPNSGFMVFEGDISNDDGEIQKSILGQAYVWYDPETKTVCLDNIEIPTRLLKKLRKGNKHGDVLSTNTLINAVEKAAESIMIAMNKKGIEVKKVTTGKANNDLKRELQKKFGAPETKNLAMNRKKGVYTDADEAQYVIKTYDEVTKMYGNAIFENLSAIQADLADIEKAKNAKNPEKGGV